MRLFARLRRLSGEPGASDLARRVQRAARGGNAHFAPRRNLVPSASVIGLTWCPLGELLEDGPVLPSASWRALWARGAASPARAVAEVFFAVRDTEGGPWREVRRATLTALDELCPPLEERMPARRSATLPLFLDMATITRLERASEAIAKGVAGIAVESSISGIARRALRAGLAEVEREIAEGRSRFLALGDPPDDAA